MNCLYVLEIKPLLVASFANIFSQSIDCLFVLLMVSFAVQKLINLIRSHLFSFVFLSPWETDLGKHWYDLPQRMFCLCSFLKVLWCYVSYLSPWVILSLFLCMMWGHVPISLIYMWLSSSPNTTCWRDCLFPIVYSCLLGLRKIDHRCGNPLTFEHLGSWQFFTVVNYVIKGIFDLENTCLVK